MRETPGRARWGFWVTQLSWDVSSLLSKFKVAYASSMQLEWALASS